MMGLFSIISIHSFIHLFIKHVFFTHSIWSPELLNCNSCFIYTNTHTYTHTFHAAYLLKRPKYFILLIFPGLDNYILLENPRDSGAWWAAVYGVAQSQTRLK